MSKFHLTATITRNLTFPNCFLLCLQDRASVTGIPAGEVRLSALAVTGLKGHILSVLALRVATMF